MPCVQAFGEATIYMRKWLDSLLLNDEQSGIEFVAVMGCSSVPNDYFALGIDLFYGFQEAWRTTVTA